MHKAEYWLYKAREGTETAARKFEPASSSNESKKQKLHRFNI